MRGRALRPLVVLLIAIVVTSIVFVPPTSGTLRVAARPAPIRVTASTPEAIGPFEPNIKITDGSSPFGWQVEPTMVVNESGTVFVGWKETNGPDAAGYRVGSSYSTDQGRTWANNILMNQTHPNQNCRDSDPWMALDPRDRVHFAYLEYDPSGGSLPPCGSGLDVSNTSDGQDWGTVHYIPGLGGLVDKDSIAFDSAGRLYAAWDEGNILALSWSDDDGNHWAPIRNPGNVGHSVLGAVVATFENSTVYLTWWDIDTNNIMFEASSNRGQTWSPQVQVNDRIGSAVRSTSRGATTEMGIKTSTSRTRRTAARRSGLTTGSTTTPASRPSGWWTWRSTAAVRSTPPGKTDGLAIGTYSTRTRRTGGPHGPRISECRRRTRPDPTIDPETTSRSRSASMIRSTSCGRTAEATTSISSLLGTPASRRRRLRSRRVRSDCPSRWTASRCRRRSKKPG